MKERARDKQEERNSLSEGIMYEQVVGGRAGGCTDGRTSVIR